jgi:hypothetical protein
MPKKWVEAENESLGDNVYVFKTKLELGLELIDDLKERGIHFSHCLIDAWYGNSPDFICRSADQRKNRKGVEYRKHLYITPLYANRRIFCRLRGELDISSSMWKFQKVVHLYLLYLWSASGRYSYEVDASFSEVVYG